MLIGELFKIHLPSAITNAVQDQFQQSQLRNKNQRVHDVCYMSAD